MAIPNFFSAFVPSNITDLLKFSNFTAAFVPFQTLNSTFADVDAIYNVSRHFVSKANSKSYFNHCLRMIFYSYALLHTGFPSEPGNEIGMISSKELTHRIYLASMLHDLGFTEDKDLLRHRAHTTSFELFGGFLAFDHLNDVAYPSVTDEIIGDVIQSTTLHTIVFQTGNSSTAGSLLQLSSILDVSGWDGVGPGVFDRLWHNDTIAEIERYIPRLDIAHEAGEHIKDMYANKPNCFITHDTPRFDPDAIEAIKTLIR